MNTWNPVISCWKVIVVTKITTKIVVAKIRTRKHICKAVLFSLH